MAVVAAGGSALGDTSRRENVYFPSTVMEIVLPSPVRVFQLSRRGNPLLFTDGCSVGIISLLLTDRIHFVRLEEGYDYHGLVFSPDGRWLARLLENTLTVWRCDTGRVVFRDGQLFAGRGGPCALPSGAFVGLNAEFSRRVYGVAFVDRGGLIAATRTGYVSVDFIGKRKDEYCFSGGAEWPKRSCDSVQLVAAAGSVFAFSNGTIGVPWLGEDRKWRLRIIPARDARQARDIECGDREVCDAWLTSDGSRYVVLTAELREFIAFSGPPDVKYKKRAFDIVDSASLGRLRRIDIADCRPFRVVVGERHVFFMAELEDSVPRRYAYRLYALDGSSRTEHGVGRGPWTFASDLCEACEEKHVLAPGDRGIVAQASDGARFRLVPLKQ